MIGCSRAVRGALSNSICAVDVSDSVSIETNGRSHKVTSKRSEQIEFLVAELRPVHNQIGTVVGSKCGTVRAFGASTVAGASINLCSTPWMTRVVAAYWLGNHFLPPTQRIVDMMHELSSKSGAR